MRAGTGGRGWLALAPAAAAAAVLVVARQRDRRDASRRRFDLELDAATAEVRARLEAEAERLRRHDLVNAFTAVEGAATILAREGLRPADRTMLNEVLESGLTRVRALLHSSSGASEFSLDDAATTAVKDLPWDGGVEIEVAPDLVGRGSTSEVTETVRQLLTFGHRRAPAGSLRLRGSRDGDTVVLWAEDRGPAISAKERQAILDPDRRGSHPDDAVTELHVAIRLTREQGGSVRIENRPDGGASFGICMPVSL